MEDEKPVKHPNTPNDKSLSHSSLPERGDVVVVNILGNEIRLRTGTDSAYIHKLAVDIENRIRHCMSDSGVMSSLKAVILVCLELADELEKSKQQHFKKDKIWEEKIDKLLDKISAI
ncbi:MAG: cell division protein ZapA [Candidatus Ratteibacteria bacterium]|nr:cell division protein ZapA [Candidatus Ratteibacteria bacterium]